MNPRLEGISDEDLMVQTREGNMTAFETLVRRHYTRLALYIANVLGNADSAEDLAQEALLRAFCARERYVPTARWTTWVRKIAQNLSRDEYRRQRHEEFFRSLDEPCLRLLEDSSLLREALVDPSQVPPDVTLCRRETFEELRHMVESLSPKHAQVLKMRVYGEMNYQEIADSLGCSLGTVKSRIHYAIQELRGRLLGPSRMQAS